MKTTALLALALLCSAAVFAQPQPAAPRPVRSADAATASPETDPVNYLVAVKWADAKAGTNLLQVLTAPGSFTLDTIQNPVRIGDNDVPTTVSFNGTLSEVSAEKVKVTLFLGRTVPYVTGSSSGPGGKNQSYQQLRVGLNTTLSVPLGKTVVIQSDASGEVTLTIKRQDN